MRKRQIKFRVRNEETKEIIGYDYLGDNSEWLHKYVKDKNEYPSSGACLYGGKILKEQFAGLLDMRGREIYEGDIVTQHKLKTEYFGEINGEIIYYQPECSFEIAILSENKEERFLTPLRETMTLEIIGNIYEKGF